MKKILLFFAFLICLKLGFAQRKKPRFKVIAFFTAKHDPAHISFVNEANEMFQRTAKSHHFDYDTTTNWRNLNAAFLSSYQAVIFLDTRPEKPEQRVAFQTYMESGGSWMGFHFAGFALEKSSYDMDWDWYHNQFLGSGSFLSNTWKPTSAVLRVEKPKHPTMKDLPAKFRSQPNEWYRWKNDLRENANIDILLSIDPLSFPLGTGPKQAEIWNSGYYPVVWTNKKYRMIYINMGHNDMDYEHKIDASNKTISYTFDNVFQNRLVLNSLLWLVGCCK